jgi:hypothetical protein
MSEQDVMKKQDAAFKAAIASAPKNIGSQQLANGWLVWATDGSGNAIAPTFVPK